MGSDELKICAIFGGFLQPEPNASAEEGNAFTRFFDDHPADDWTRYANFTRDEEDLNARWERSASCLNALSIRPTVADIGAYSMGAHLAIRLALSCQELGVNHLRVCLLAPDPKYRETLGDHEGPSAHREACALCEPPFRGWRWKAP